MLQQLHNGAYVEFRDPSTDFVEDAIRDSKCAAIDLGGTLVGVNRRERACGSWLAALPPGSALRGITFYDDDARDWLTVSVGGFVERTRGARIDVRDTFVFFDQAHTRGADHRLRPGAIAVMSVGPNPTTDALLQAAARMRGLGVGQEIEIRVDRGSDADVGLSQVWFGLVCNTLCCLSLGLDGKRSVSRRETHKQDPKTKKQRRREKENHGSSSRSSEGTSSCLCS